MRSATRRARRPAAELPGWIAGDWSPLVRDPIDLMRLALLVGVPVTLVLGPREQSFRLFLTFLIVLVPRALDVPRPFDLAFVAAMWFQAWGNVFGAFDRVGGYDKLVHFALPCASSALLYLLLVRLRIVPELESEKGLRQRAGILLLTFALGFSFMGGLYELYEWFANHYLGAQLHVGYADSIGDLTDDMLGALMGGALILAWDSYGWGTRRRANPPGGRPADDDPVARVGDSLAQHLEPGSSVRPQRRPHLRLPAFLAGDWRGQLRDPLDVLRLCIGAGVVVAIAEGRPETAVRLLLSFVAVLGVRRLDVPRPLDLAFVLAMAVQGWGAVLGVFDVVGAYGPVSHILVSAGAAPVLYIALIRMRLVPDLARRPRLHQRAAIGLVGFAFGFSAGILYELYVFVANNALAASFGVDYPLLIERLAVDALGALGGGALLVAWASVGWGTTRLPARKVPPHDTPQALRAR